MDHAIAENCLERFVAGRSSPAENRSLVAHLLKGCRHCSRKLAALLQPDVPPEAYDRVFVRMESFVPDTWSALRNEDLHSLLVQVR
jgi:hypothetical protein